jgi:excisionase family DNA binding protein
MLWHHDREEVVSMSREDLMTAAQVAEVLHMRPDSVVRKIHRGEIPALKVGARWMVRRETLEAILSSAIPSPQGR